LCRYIGSHAGRRCLNSLRTNPPVRLISFSTPKRGLDDFFDLTKDFGNEVGRPWKLEELRIKSNADLHKLWYILLKEVNMLLTMEEEFRRMSKQFPSPDRLDKCEESMENILQVVGERDETLNLLETGFTGKPKREWRYDMLGRPEIYEHKEHLVPKHLNEDYEENRHGYPEDNEKFLWLLRERDLKEKAWKEALEMKHQRRLKDIWPENETLKQVPDPNGWKEDYSGGNTQGGH